VPLAELDVVTGAFSYTGRWIVGALLDRGLLVSHEPSLGKERFTEWTGENAATLGRVSASELARNFRGSV